MNGGANKIEIFKPFEEALGLTKQILFQPFDLAKWFVIGFTAWLANLGSGNYNFNLNREDLKNVPFFRDAEEALSQVPPWLLICGAVGIFIFLIAIMILFAWLRSRGCFMFIDCVVKNRGVIAEPWREFREQGNSYFLLKLVVAIVIAVTLAIAALPFILLVIKRTTFEQAPVYFICAIAFWAIVFAALIVAWGLISHFMVMVMYRRRCLAREGWQVAVSLISNYPGEITLYCLFWIALTIGSAMASCVVVLATCCIALIPYVGTVILLPLFVCLRAFGLRFARQFGPEYDVWAGILETATPPPVPPPLPS